MGTQVQQLLDDATKLVKEVLPLQDPTLSSRCNALIANAQAIMNVLATKMSSASGKGTHIAVHVHVHGHNKDKEAAPAAAEEDEDAAATGAAETGAAETGAS